MISPKKTYTAASLLTGAVLLLFASCREAGSDPSLLWLNADTDSAALECRQACCQGEPFYARRILNHWDNLDDTVERGYAGPSLWEWTSDSIPTERIRRYGRLNASIGINGAVLNNVNASPAVLDPDHLQRVAAIADLLRPYGIRVYLSVNFASPMHLAVPLEEPSARNSFSTKTLGPLPTADPLDARVEAWWAAKAAEIYRLVPDFGGFLVKASSEGQPGPQDFGRSHAQGANRLADALAPYGGIVMWRAFVYSAQSPDRARQACEEFCPLDGAFRDNVTVQIKNGPVDFQPREPFNPLFGQLYATATMPELQITQEYLGQSRQLVFLAPWWQECLLADTYRDGPGSTVALLTRGSARQAEGSAIAGVANTGRSADWCGSLFAQANWYAFGRLAWNPSLSAQQVAEDWLRLQFPRPHGVSERRFDRRFVQPVARLMLASHEAAVNYMMPLGLHHLFAWGHHYGPEPWCEVPGAREDWLPRYYHRADSSGIGFDRTLAGSGAVAQYHEPLCSLYNRAETCPPEYLLWFHHLPWDYPMPSGDDLWTCLCRQYRQGVEQADGFCRVWQSVRPFVPADVYGEVMEQLQYQAGEARRWRDACLGYFQTFSGRPVVE